VDAALSLASSTVNGWIGSAAFWVDDVLHGPAPLLAVASATVAVMAILRIFPASPQLGTEAIRYSYIRSCSARRP
jgi:hypothetical protein